LKCHSTRTGPSTIFFILSALLLDCIFFILLSKDSPAGFMDFIFRLPLAQPQLKRYPNQGLLTKTMGRPKVLNQSHSFMHCNILTTALLRREKYNLPRDVGRIVQSSSSSSQRTANLMPTLLKIQFLIPACQDAKRLKLAPLTNNEK